jgi:tetratricopeptide (TPR) repeat protein
LDLDQGEDEAKHGEGAPPIAAETHDLIGNDLTMRLLALAFIPHRNLLELQDRLTLIIEEHDMNTSDDAQISRRDALRRLATLPLLTLKLNASQPVLHSPVRDILTQCAASIGACWELSKGDDEADLTLAFKGVSAYMPTLKAIVKDSLQHHKEAASLAGQSSLLKTMLGWHLEGLNEAAVYAQDAVTYAREAEDGALLLSSLDYQAWLHYYSNRSKQAQSTIEQALPLLKEFKTPLPPRLLGGIYSTIALMRAKNGLRAIVPLRQAAEAFFGAQEEEHRFVYMDYTKGDLVLNDGMVHYQQGDHDKALDSLSQLIDPETLALKIALPERSRIEGLNIMTLASLKSSKKDMERTLHFWKTAVQGSRALQSEQRFKESLVGYEIMESVWSGERRIIELRDLAIHW